MTKFLAIIFLGLFLSFQAKAIFPSDPQSQLLYTSANTKSPLEGLGSVVDQSKGLLTCVYDFAVLGGTGPSYALLDQHGNTCKLPAGAVVVRDYIKTLTAFVVNGGASTVAFGILVFNDMKTATSTASYTGMIEGALTGVATAAVGPFTTASTTVNMYSTSLLTAGKVEIFLEYVVQ